MSCSYSRSIFSKTTRSEKKIWEIGKSVRQYLVLYYSKTKEKQCTKLLRSQRSGCAERAYSSVIAAFRYTYGTEHLVQYKHLPNTCSLASHFIRVRTSYKKIKLIESTYKYGRHDDRTLFSLVEHANDLRQHLYVYCRSVERLSLYGCYLYIFSMLTLHVVRIEKKNNLYSRHAFMRSTLRWRWCCGVVAAAAS